MAKPGPDTARPSPSDDTAPGASPHWATLQRYYRRIAPRLLMHARGREVTPVQVGNPSDTVAESPLIEPRRLHDRRELLGLCAAGAVAFHAPASRLDAPHCPDQMIHALSGEGGDFEALKTAAATLADLLEELGLTAYPLLDGLGGLQLRVPLDARADHASTRALARRLSRAMELQDPKRYSARPDAAGQRLFIDYRPNAPDSTPVLPYSLRPVPGWPVAAPLSWEMLADPDLDERGLSRHRVMHWPLGPDPRAGDPWYGEQGAGFEERAGSVAQAHARLDRSATTV